MASRGLGKWYFDETYAACMLEMAVDDLNMDGTFSSEVYKVHIFDLGNIDMNERFADVTGMDEG